MVDLKQWQLSETIEGAAASGLLASNDFVLIWNPCDGHHLYDLSKHSAAKIAAEARDGFGTHWRLMPDGPDVTPEDWSPIETLADAADDLPLFCDVLLWSPTGAHSLSWVRHVGILTILEEGRRGLYTAWRLPPARPVE